MVVKQDFEYMSEIDCGYYLCLASFTLRAIAVGDSG
jgi:hypothetical protein